MESAEKNTVKRTIITVIAIVGIICILLPLIFLVFGFIFCAGVLGLSMGGGVAAVVVPIAFIIGIAIMGFIIFLLSRLFKTKKKQVFPKQQQAIVDFIHQARRNEFNDELIRSALMDKGGWTAAEVTEAFKSA